MSVAVRDVQGAVAVNEARLPVDQRKSFRTPATRYIFDPAAQPGLFENELERWKRELCL